jgi:RHS repeat-associated protein
MEFILLTKLPKIKKLLNRYKKVSFKSIVFFFTFFISYCSTATDNSDLAEAGGSDSFSKIGSIGPGISDRLNIKETSTDVMGDQIALSSGGLSIQITDEVLKGVGPLISLTRQSTMGVKKVASPVEYVGGWEFPIPYIKTTTLLLASKPKGPWEEEYGNVACKSDAEFGYFPYYTNLSNGGGTLAQNETGLSSFVSDGSDTPTTNAMQYAAVGTHEFYNGIFFSIPGQVHELVGGQEGSITKSGWKKSCVENSSSTISGAFSYYYKMTSPSGTVYSFGQPRRINARAASSTAGLIQNTYMLITNITDRFGNVVNYNYKQLGFAKARLESIVAADGRKISLKYETVQSTQIIQADVLTTSNDTILKSYKYGYESGSNTLSYTQRPDGTKWLHNLSAGQPSTSTNYCGSNNELNFHITHPNGLRADYHLVSSNISLSEVEYKPIIIPSQHAGTTVPKPDRRSNVYRTCSPTYSIKTKTLTFTNGDSYQWEYSYNSGHGYFQVNYDNTVFIPTEENRLSNNDIPAGLNSLHIKTTKVIEPDNNYTLHYYNRDASSRHLNAEVASQSFDKNGVKKRTIVTEYDDTKAVFVNVIAHYNESVESATHRAIKKKRTVTLYTDTGDDVYTINFLTHNQYALPTSIQSIFNGKSKFTKQEYMHDEGLWVLNQPTKTQISEVNASYTPVSETSYYAKDHESYPSMPYREKSFGVWQQEYTEYHNNGLIKRIEYNSPLTFGSGNRYQILDSYKRGIAQSIKVPNRASTSSIESNKTVNDLGQVTSTTDLNRNVTGYKYDVLGRLKSVDMPSTYEDTLFSWSNNGGLSGLEPKRITQRCNLNSAKAACSGNVKFTEISTFDSLFRPVLISTSDGINPVYVNSEFDIYGNNTFQSFPSISEEEDQGNDTLYDIFQRPVETKIHGSQAILTRYLAGNKREITDAEMNVTTTTYLAYSAPSYEQAILIESPETVTTTLNVNVFGDVLSIKQEGTLDYSVSQTEYRAYDSQHRLCQIKRNDVGTTVMARNTSGEVTWVAEGQNGASNIECNTTTTPDSKVHFTYGNLGENRTIRYEDGTPTRTISLDNNGNIKTIVGGGFSQSYNYNSLNLLEDESLTVSGRSGRLTLDYDYNSLGHLASLKYPGDIEPVSFSPNGFGQPTKAIRDYSDTSLDDVFVNSTASYYPSGQINTFTYGNNIVHKTTMNSRLMPSQITDKFGSSVRVDLSYSYDSNNNITKITNTRDAGIYSLSNLTYDGLDRLKTTTGGIGIGSTTLTYDGLGNIRKYTNTSVFDSHDLTYGYTNNRLTILTGSGSSGYNFNSSSSYDPRGNVTNNGKRDFDYNLAGQMIKSGSNRYVYDGYNRRIKTTDSKGTSYSMYSQSGKLLYRETPLGGINYILFGSKLVAKEGTGVVSSGDSIMNYKPFGDSIESPKDEVGYTGHKFDTDLGLSYMQARYYDPVIGRFYSNDPKGFSNVHNFNRYTYANNNPYRYVDPDGREGVDVRLNIAMNSIANGSMSLSSYRSSIPSSGTAVDFVPVFGDVKGIAEAVNTPSAANITAAIVGMVPILGDIASKAIKGADVTASTVSHALSGDTVQATQSAISLPAVQRYVDRINNGEVAPAISMSGNIVTDGHHRYVAGKITGVMPEVRGGTLTGASEAKIQPMSTIKADSVDWGNQ